MWIGVTPKFDNLVCLGNTQSYIEMDLTAKNGFSMKLVVSCQLPLSLFSKHPSLAMSVHCELAGNDN